MQTTSALPKFFKLIHEGMAITSREAQQEILRLKMGAN